MSSEPHVFNLSATVTKEHVEEFLFAAMKFRNQSAPRSKLKTIALFVGSALLFLAMFQYFGDTTTLSFLTGCAASLAFVFVAQWLSFASSFRDGGLLLGHRQFTANADGVQVKGPNTAHQLSWRVFMSTMRTENCVILWTDPAAGEIIPKVAFPDAASMEEFTKFANEQISQSNAA